MAINKRIIRSNDEGGVAASFNTVLYTGDGTSNRQITGVGFQPDFIWTKSRSLDWDHVLADSVRGFSTVDGDVKYLTSDLAEAEFERDGLRSFDPDGFTVDTYPNANDNNQTFVAWCWKAGGAAVSNTDGTITSQVSANPAAGFSVVSYTGNVSGATIGHGLGVKPNMAIVKDRDNSQNWHVYFDGITSDLQDLRLNTDQPLTTVTNERFIHANINNSVIELGSSGGTNALGDKYIAYCFAEVAGFSKFGSYTGNAPLLGTGSTIPINCGFEPAFVLIKSTTYSPSSWTIWDNKRDTANPNTKILLANLSSQELDFAAYGIDFDSNGFTIGAAANDLTNLNGNSYIYMAFANQF